MTDKIPPTIREETETIEVVNEQNLTYMLWEPVVGNELLDLLNYKDIPEESKTSLTEETRRILGKCVSPTLDVGAKTGLVIGYVQSGKTLSFTAVSAMARDNGFPVLIVISGVSVPLSGQSKTRLQDDLRLNERPDRSWLPFNNPNGWSDEDAIRRVLEEWHDPSMKEKDRQTVLITVMKNHKHLNNLINVLKNLDLSGLPVLIIDDEADQASFNTKAKKGEESTTYSRIVELRRQIPNHTFLQYTATPQAPLLISLIDILSPDFAEILTPGPDYIGGKQFFREHKGLIRTIPDSEKPDIETPDPPDSLIYALRIFFLGVAVAIKLGSDRKGNRSMLVHPSRKTIGHHQFFQWVHQIQKRLQDELALPDSEPDKQALIQEFQEAYKDLSDTVSGLPAFDTLLDSLRLAIRRTRLEEVNASTGKGTPTIDWKGSYSYILVGGQAMDRGFTVEGLTVTYMPRSTGVGNADTLQQRARFFGYKKSYLGYCRVFLDHKMRQALEAYIDHEEDIQGQLRDYSNTGKPLSEWKRVFNMPFHLHPTRGNVIVDSYTQGNFSNEWYAPTIIPSLQEHEEANRKVTDEFIQAIKLTSDKGHIKRTPQQKHLINESLSLQHVYKGLLKAIKITDKNSQERYEGLLLQIKKHLEKYPDETCTLYVMSRESIDTEWQPRERSVGGELFQGANPDKSGEFYPGDRNLGDQQRVVIQLHRLSIKNTDRTDVRFVAVRIPEKMNVYWLAQMQQPKKS